MMSHAKSVDNRIDDACDTGVLILAGKNLRNYPINSEEEAPFCHKDLLEVGKKLRGVVGTLVGGVCEVVANNKS